MFLSHTVPVLFFHSDNYTKFWNINAQLVGLDNPASVKGIPFRIYLKDLPVVQKVFAPVNASGKMETLEVLLREVTPQLFEAGKVPKLLIHGISPSLATPLAWLGENMSYPDNFLHIIVLS